MLLLNKFSFVLPLFSLGQLAACLKNICASHHVPRGSDNRRPMPFQARELWRLSGLPGVLPDSRKALRAQAKKIILESCRSRAAALGLHRYTRGESFVSTCRLHRINAITVDGAHEDRSDKIGDLLRDFSLVNGKEGF